MKQLQEIFREAAERRAIDVHLLAGEPPIFRINSALERQPSHPKFAAEELTEILLTLLPAATRLGLENGSLSTAKTVVALADDVPASFHLTIFRSGNGFGAAARILLNDIPSLEFVAGDALVAFQRISALKRGLVLFTGPTGCGKLTTAAAVVDVINRSRTERIYVVGDTAGYTWKSKQSVVTTWLVGRDHESYERAAEVLLRGGDPDVILFEDIPTPEAARQALILADVGNLVIASVGAESAADAIVNLSLALPEPRQTALDLLARNLAVVVNQRLLLSATGRGRVAAYEIVFVTPEIRRAIHAAATRAELDSVIAQSDEAESRSLSAALDALVADGKITEDAAAAHRPIYDRPQDYSA